MKKIIIILIIKKTIIKIKMSENLFNEGKINNLDIDINLQINNFD